MKRIYTRTGDSGTTAIHGGQRVSKTDPRIEANGQLDTLNTAIGTVRAFLPPGSSHQPILRRIQLDLMTVMSRVATPSALRAENPNPLRENLTSEVEGWIDALASEYGPAEYFLLPGGTPAAAFMHQARVAARTAERRLLALNEVDPVETGVLSYINRLSDLFFIMARAEMLRADVAEEQWREFAYKRSLRR